MDSIYETPARATLAQGEAFRREVERAIREGWTLAYRDDAICQAQFTKRKGKSLLIGIVLYCCLIVPGLIYSFLWTRTDQKLYISVDERGKVKRVRR